MTAPGDFTRNSGSCCHLRRVVRFLSVVMGLALLTTGCWLRRDERPSEPMGAGPPVATILAFSNYVIVPVYYATDRQPVTSLAAWKAKLHEEGSDLEYYGSRYRPELELGICAVSIPTRVHRAGRVERPHWYESDESPQKHFTILTLNPVSQDEFIVKIDRQLERTRESDAFVFIHGYNVKFSAAVMRTAQLTYDWGFGGVPILYSWPSDGTLLRYDRDQESAELTCSHFRRFLREVVTKTKATNIHLIAHSMGNRVLTQVLREFTLESNHPTFSEVILAAPDVNRIQFLDRIAPFIPGIAKRVSLYASSKDKALMVAKLKSDYARAGEGGMNLVVCKGIETIDASAVDTDMIGHGYLAEARSVIEDLSAVLLHSVPVDKRQLIRQATVGGLQYWKIRPRTDGAPESR